MKACSAIHLAATGAIGIGVSFAAANPVRDGPVVATLLSDVETIRPGSRFTLAIKLDIDPPWHAYWINPGDSGLPPSVEWSFPEGFSVGPILAPPPIAFPDPPFTTFGHAGTVVYLFDVSAPSSPPFVSVEFSAAVDWMVCHDLCLPGHADLSVKLPISNGPDRNASRNSDLFASARRILPQPDSPWAFSAHWTQNRLLLDAVLSNGAVLSVSSAYFFPAKPGIVDHSAPQNLLARANGFSVDFTPAFSSSPPDRLLGVLAVDMDGMKHHFLVDVPVSNVSVRGGAVLSELPG